MAKTFFEEKSISTAWQFRTQKLVFLAMGVERKDEDTRNR